jgi:hypothetical protein
MSPFVWISEIRLIFEYAFRHARGYSPMFALPYLAYLRRSGSSGYFWAAAQAEGSDD